MASWMVHLRIAEILLDRISDLDEEQFGIGNIAPDGGVADENWLNYDPPPEITHFTIDAYGDPFPHRDLVFYQKYLAGMDKERDVKRYSFLFGYFIHLLTDNLWRLNVGRPSKDRFLDQFETKTDCLQALRGDWYSLDMLYAHKHPQSFFWKIFLHSKYEEEYLDYFPKGSIKEKLRYIQEFYSQAGEHYEKISSRPYDYLSKQEMDSFVAESAKTIFKVYQAVKLNHADSSKMYSGLEML